MYHIIVRRRARGVFDRLSRGDWEVVLEDLAEDVHHVFPGAHPLGGERYSRAAVARWFERLYRLFPNPRFEVRRVVSRGLPHSTWVAVEWVDHVTPALGEPYEQRGAHWIRIRWGKVTDLHAYLDTQLVAEACRYMAAHGIDEAAADPIRD